MTHSLNSLKGLGFRVYTGDYIGTTIGGIRGDTRSLDYGTHFGKGFLSFQDPRLRKPHTLLTPQFLRTLSTRP